MRETIIEKDPLYEVEKKGILGPNGKWYCLHHTFWEQKQEAIILNRCYCLGLWIAIAFFNIEYSNVLKGIDVTLLTVKIVGEYLFLKPIFTGKKEGYYKYHYNNKDQYRLMFFYYLFYGASLRLWIPFLCFLFEQGSFELSLIFDYFNGGATYMLLSLIPSAYYFYSTIKKLLKKNKFVTVKDYSDFVLRYIISKETSELSFAGVRFEQAAYVYQFKNGVRKFDYLPPFADKLLEETGQDWRKESLNKFKSEEKQSITKKNKEDNVIYLYKK